MDVDMKWILEWIFSLQVLFGDSGDDGSLYGAVGWS